MVLKSIISLFDKDAQVSRQSIRDYDACREFERGVKAGFRLGAVQELVFAHMDGVFLISDHAKDFIAFSKAAGVSYQGSFADELVPKIEFVPHDATTETRIDAIETFRRFVDGGYPFISYSLRPAKDIQERMFRSDAMTRWSNRGYKIYDPVDKDSLLGIAISLNSKQIARSTIWEPQINGYLQRKLFQAVNSSKDGERGSAGKTQFLDFEIFFHDPDSTTLDLRMACCVPFTFLMLEGTASFAKLNTMFSGLSDFLAAIESHVTQMPSYWTKDEGDMEFYRDMFPCRSRFG